MKTIYLMRHSIPEKINLETSLIPLSTDGLKLAKSKRTDFLNIDYCYTSPYTRAVKTAKQISNNIEILYDLHERIIGEAYEDFWLKQYLDFDYANKNGESLNQVKKRMKITIDKILNDINEGDKVLVISHATAICAYLLNYCKIIITNATEKSRKITFNNDVILNGKIEPTSYFEIKYQENNIYSITFNK